jgi:hypothetical protein
MKTLQLFEQLSTTTRQSKLRIRVEHENLETVYFEPTLDGRILVHDRGHAHTYLSTRGDKAYRDWKDLGLAYLRQHCDEASLSLENLIGDETDPCFSICSWATTDQEVAKLIDRVAACLDAIFEAAYREPVSKS